VLAASLVLLVSGFRYAGHLKQAFFPKDNSYLSYVDVWLPEDAPMSATAEAARDADDVIRKTLDAWDKTHPSKDGRPALKSITTFIGGGGPRFWFSVTPEVQQANYAQLVVEANDKHVTNEIIHPLQQALSREISETSYGMTTEKIVRRDHYRTIGGLTIATFLTLLLVPVIYAIFVLDLRIVPWEERRHPQNDVGDTDRAARSTPEPRRPAETSAAPVD
jgi:multidrug efflux pump subunit AcrB